MMTIHKPEKPYIILESLDPLNNQVPNHTVQSALQERERLVHLISADEKQPIKIGRANEC
jgi:hypothetical protein